MLMPALDTTSPTMFTIDCGGKATGRSNVRSYAVIVDDVERRALADVEPVEVRLGQRTARSGACGPRGS